MQYLDALEGLRSLGYPNEEVTVRRYEMMQIFIEGVRNFELKRSVALMYACAVLIVQKIINWLSLNNHNLRHQTNNQNCPGNSTANTTTSASATSTTGTL